MMRYFQAASGPIATAVAHFLLSLVLLHGASPETFGQLSFLLIASQFGAGVWGALFCAPLPVVLAQADPEKKGTGEDIQRCFFASNLLAGTFAFFCYWGVSYSVGLAVLDAGIFAGYCAGYLLRWFARANAYILGRPLAAFSSDLIYSTILIAALGAMAIWPAYFSVCTVCFFMLFAVSASLLPFGVNYLRAQFLDVSPRDAGRYFEIWRKHSSWSLMGVMTTEATANSHAYLLAMIAGPGAFAPIAASALLIRPIGVIVNALTEMERPNVARLIGMRKDAESLRALTLFRWIVMVAWCGGAVTGFLLLAFAPYLVFPKMYELRFLIIGTTLWMLVMFARQWRAPESVLLQAAGEFKALAHASVISAVASIGAVLALLITVDTVWSVAGILVGETLCTYWTWRMAQRYRLRLIAGSGGAVEHSPQFQPKVMPLVSVNRMEEK